MEFIDASSSPATIAELDLFQLPPTQTVIESMYDVEYRPIGSLSGANVFEFVVPASEHYTDLAATYLHAKLKIVSSTKTAGTASSSVELSPTDNFGASLFEQLDVELGQGYNITKGNSLYHYQSFIEDLFFRYDSPVQRCSMIDDDKEDTSQAIKQELFDLILPIHAPLFQQEKFLIDGISMLLRFKPAAASFGLIASDAKTEVKLTFEHLSLFIRRVKLFTPTQMTLSASLQKSPAKYHFQRNEVRAFLLSNGFASNSIDNIFNGQLPKKVIIGFVSDKAFNNDITSDPFKFEHKNLTDISLVVNGVKIPCSSYKPNFAKKLYMREFYSLFRSMSQEYSIPRINMSYSQYESKYPLFVFDLSDDGTLTNDSGALSLVKRGNIRCDLTFASELTSAMHMIVFGIYDSILQIDADRNISIDY